MTSNCATTCSLYLIPSSHLQNISHDILTFLTTLINSSLTSGCIPAPFKTATIKPLLKNPPLTKVTSTTTDIFLFFHSSIKPWNTTSATNCPIFHKTTSLTLISQASGLLTPLTRQSSQWLSHSTLQTKPRPTHQSSFSSTYSLRLTQSPTNSSSPLWLNLASLTLLLTGSDHTWQIAPFMSHGMAHCPNLAFWKLVSFKA